MKILSSASARPNFVKLAAISHACARAMSPVEHVIIHTGQHYDPLLSDVFFQQLDVPAPTANLGIKGGGDREEVIRQTADAMRPVLDREKPSVVLVYGDVNGALGAARAAHDLKIPLAHIEAGLRSKDLSMPEELNRIEIDNLSQHLFVSEQSGMDHLESEHVKGKAHFVGNTMISTLLRMMPVIQKASLPPKLPERFVVATIHRPSNVDTPDAARMIVSFLTEVSQKIPVVLPLHPRTAAALERHRVVLPSSIVTISPLGYIEFLALASRADCILTDSGGIQEEALVLQKRCFTLRQNTERPSTIACGSNILIDPSQKADRALVHEFLRAPSSLKIVRPPLWDDHAGERILEILLSLYSQKKG